MNQKVILIAILILILIGSFSFLYFNLFNQEITGEVVIDSIKHDFKLKGGVDKGNLGFLYSYTKAICNESNYCQDYEIVCRNGEVVGKNALTGAVVQHSSDWEDPRDNETRGVLC